MKDYMRGIDDETFEKVIKACKDKVEGLSDKDWQDIVEEFDLNIHRDVLRKGFQSPFGSYPLLKYIESKEIKNQPKNKLDEIVELIGELDIKKQEIRTKTSKMNKIKKDLIKSVEIANDIKEYILDDIENIELFEFERIESSSDYKLIVGIQDWHIGYVINNYKGNSYNYEIAKKRLSKLISEIKSTCERYNISDVTVVNCGDIIENAYMRETQQAFECEFNMSEQISKAIKLLYEFVTTISEFANVDLVTVGGNHSRVSQKATNIEGDNSNVIIKETIETLVEVSGNNRIKVLDIDYVDDSCVFEVNGLKVKALHGDNRTSDTKKLFDSESSIDGVVYDLIMLGHWHNFNIRSMNSGGYVVIGSSLFGYNPYSVKRISTNSNAGQTLIVVGDGEIESIKNVNLQFN